MWAVRAPTSSPSSPLFYNYGINTVILRNRLRADGYVAEADAVDDARLTIEGQPNYWA
jgi:hypothetical protein